MTVLRMHTQLELLYSVLPPTYDSQLTRGSHNPLYVVHTGDTERLFCMPDRHPVYAV